MADIGGGTTAASLGIAGSVASNTLTGSNINYISNGTSLNALNDGRGIRLNPDAGNDLTLALANGSTYNINLSTSKTVGDVLTAINTATAGKATASIASNGRGLTVTDNTTGSGTFAITNDVGSEAATDLWSHRHSLGKHHHRRTGAGQSRLGACLQPQRRQRRAPWRVTIVNRNGQTHSLNLAGAAASATSCPTSTAPTPASPPASTRRRPASNSPTRPAAAAIWSSPTATQRHRHRSRNRRNVLIVANRRRVQSAFPIHLAKHHAVELQRQQGVTLGTFAITNSAGRVSDINLAQSKASTIGDVINAINSADAGVTASINANGNGLLLTDTAGGAGTLTVADDGSTTAADLNIAGTATGTTLDGSLGNPSRVTSSDTLTTLEGKINSLGFGVSASIITDGSSTNPYRLALTSLNSGSAGPWSLTAARRISIRRHSSPPRTPPCSMAERETPSRC